jgi:hypothetical protein
MDMEDTSVQNACTILAAQRRAASPIRPVASGSGGRAVAPIASHSANLRLDAALACEPHVCVGSFPAWLEDRQRPAGNPKEQAGNPIAPNRFPAQKVNVCLLQQHFNGEMRISEFLSFL